MSGTKVQWRGGTTSQHNSFTGADREVTVDTTKKTLVVHDGSKQGGYPLATEADLQSLGSASSADIVQGTGSSTTDVMSQKAVTDALDSMQDGLGSAATRDVTTSNADVTPGRLLKVGDLGSNKRQAVVVDFNELPDLYPYSGAVPVMSDEGSTNAPPNGQNIYYHVEQHFYSSSAGNVTQIAIPYRVDYDGLWMRSRYYGSWSSWREIYHTGNKPSWGDISGKPTTATRWPSWGEVTGKPSTFNPSSHNHSASNITSGTLPGARMPMGAGGVGTYAFVTSSSPVYTWGQTAPGSNLRTASVSDGVDVGNSLSGTWRIMGNGIVGAGNIRATLALRVS